MSEFNYGSLETKLDILIRLFALVVAPETLSLKSRALLLQKAGLAPKEIAALCDTTANTVSVALSAAKRAEAKAGSKAKRKT